MQQIKKLLIANRGEIAMRIIRTCQTMNIQTVVVHSLEDKDSLFVRSADEAIILNGNTLAETYLNIPKIIEVARQNKIDAIHPGYGFLSENATFAKACREANILFVGPPIEAIELMGDKVASRKFAEENGIPLLKGITGSHAELLAKKEELIFPVIIKASAGGGGKGMRIVRQKDDLEDALEATAREARSYFGNDEVFIERYIENPRHIEVQILGDQLGNVLHLFERECTIQRRHQKIIEEAPSVTLSKEQRDLITKSAVQLAKAANYYSAGTVEFIVDEELNFFFMEMNTRIQVEHPVTEKITGLDLIAQQINIAEGKPLNFSQDEIKINGHAIECRIYAEDPRNEFRPSPGNITAYFAPTAPEVRVDAALNKPQEVSGSYDPMISKVITHGENRDEAITKMQTALNEYIIEGIPTNIDYLKSILNDNRFRNNEITTNYCNQFTKELLEKREKEKKKIDLHRIGVSALAYDLSGKNSDENVWNYIGWYRLNSHIPISVDGEDLNVRVKRNNGKLEFLVDNQRLDNLKTRIFPVSSNTFIAEYGGYTFQVTRNDELDENKDYAAATISEESSDVITSPIPGTVVKLIIKEGQEVQKGDATIIVEAMKMENTLAAPRAGIIESINANEGEKVEAGKILISLKKRESEEKT